MQASTASACLRRLSDWVNSVSKPHASALAMILDIFNKASLFFVVTGVTVRRETEAAAGHVGDHSFCPPRGGAANYAGDEFTKRCKRPKAFPVDSDWPAVSAQGRHAVMDRGP